MENEIITLDVTVEEYQQDLASGLCQDEVLQPGHHRFKRGGFLARHALQGKDVAMSAGKVRILIDLDHDILDYFQKRAREPNAASYQTQINRALRELIDQEHMPEQVAA